jgi:hypothetical protein
VQLRYRIDRKAMLQGARRQINMARLGAFSAVGFGGAMVVTGLTSQGLPATVERAAFLLATSAAAGLAFALIMGVFWWFVLLPGHMAVLARNNARLYGVTTCDADEDGIRFQGPHSVSTYAWGDLHGFKQSRDVFLIRLSKSLAVPIPKRELSAEQITVFGELCARKLG